MLSGPATQRRLPAEERPLLDKAADDADVEAPAQGRAGGGGRQTQSLYLARLKSGEAAPTARLLGRGTLLGQSDGHWNIEHDWGQKPNCCSLDKLQGLYATAKRRVYLSDKFHTVVNLSTWKVVMLCSVFYVVSWVVFAVPYWLVGKLSKTGCGLHDSFENGTFTFLEALFFSVETMMTIGYSAPSDPFFDQCPIALILISLQSITSLISDALLLGVIFNRLSRGTTRAKTILFSDRCVLRLPSAMSARR